MSDAPVWTPSPALAAGSNLARLMAEVRERFDPAVHDMDSLHRFSVEQPEPFWGLLWEWFDIIGDRGATVLEQPHDLRAARWFPEARLNYAENLLRGADERTALVMRDESGGRSIMTRAELAASVSRTQQALQALGIGPGDRVAACLPNRAEAVIAMLAAASLGAVWSSCAPDYGEDAMLDRFGQIAPKVLFMADGYRYNGQEFDLSRKAQAIARQVASLQRIVMVPELGHVQASVPQSCTWDGFIAAFPAGTPRFERLPWTHPLFVMYTSGTTGKPKALVHGAGGSLVQYMKDYVFHGDLQRNDTVFWHTSTGWVIWNAMVPALACEAALVLYEGSITHQAPDHLLQVMAEERVQRGRIPPPLLDRLHKLGLHPRSKFDLSCLRTITSGGAPLLPHLYDYVYEAISPDAQLASPAGGTDVNCTLVNGNPISPLWRGEMQGAALGMKVEVFDEAGRAVLGQAGELVVTAPFPSMPLGFLGDEDGARYTDTYFSMFPGIWRHGDWAERTAHGGFVIRGRADATLKVQGVRIGTSEVYRALEGFPELEEAVAVMHERAGGDALVMFVKLAESRVLDAGLQERMRKAIRARATARHVPAQIVQAPDIPRSMNGKPSEIAVRNAINARPASTAGLLNPQALEFFRHCAALGAAEPGRTEAPPLPIPTTSIFE